MGVLNKYFVVLGGYRVVDFGIILNIDNKIKVVLRCKSIDFIDVLRVLVLKIKIVIISISS